MENGVRSNIFKKLCIFKYIYVFYFLVDILHVLSILLCLFKNKFVDIIIIDSVVNTDIVQIHMLFIKQTTDLNSGTFNKQTEYHIIPEFGPQGEYLRRLSSDIKEDKFHEVEMIRDRTGQDLINVVAFQKHFALAICNALESRFKDNHIMIAFKVLAPINMSSRQISLANWEWWIWSCYMANMELNAKLVEKSSLLW